MANARNHKNDDANLIPNVNLEEIGLNAVKAWTTSDKQSRVGDSLATYVLCNSMLHPFRAVIKDAKGVEVSATTFTLADMRTPPKNTDGTTNRKMQTARMNAIGSELFGIKELSNAMKTRLNRCITVTLQLRLPKKLGGKELDSSAITLSPGDNLRVPTFLMKDEPGKDKPESVREEYAKLRDHPFVLDGTAGRGIQELARRTAPKSTTTKRNVNKPDAEANRKAFLAQVDFVKVCVKSFAAHPDKGSDLGMSPTMKKELHALMVELETYFTAEKKADEQDAADAAKKAQANASK